MLTLQVYPPFGSEPSGSPFCVKAMCLLQLAGVPWRPEIVHDPRRSPKGKLPVLVDGARTIPDSGQIRAHLEAEHGADFTAELSQEQRAISTTLIRMVEEHLYFALMCDRWMDEANWRHVRAAYFAALPRPLRGPVSGLVRRQVLRTVRGQGMGRHSADERRARAAEDIAAIRALLGAKPFLMGDAPTAADASAVPMLRALAVTEPMPGALSSLVTGDAALVAYLERGRAAMYPPATA